MLPFEFIVEGPPVSHQTKNRQRLLSWKRKVTNAAKELIAGNTTPTNEQVTFKMTYYYDNYSPDVDNIIKPVQDALTGTVYIDDEQIVETLSRKRNINGAYKIRGASRVIIEGFIKGKDFLHVIVEKYQNNQELDY